jgi:hypothetical protein
MAVNPTSDLKKAFMGAVGIVLCFFFTLLGQARFLKPHWEMIYRGSITPGSKVTNLEALGILLLGVGVCAFMIVLLSIRTVSLRQTGAMLNQTHNELLTTMPGVGQLRRHVNQ